MSLKLRAMRYPWTGIQSGDSPTDPIHLMKSDAFRPKRLSYPTQPTTSISETILKRVNDEMGSKHEGGNKFAHDKSRNRSNSENVSVSAFTKDEAGQNNNAKVSKKGVGKTHERKRFLFSSIRLYR